MLLGVLHLRIRVGRIPHKNLIVLEILVVKGGMLIPFLYSYLGPLFFNPTALMKQVQANWCVQK